MLLTMLAVMSCVLLLRLIFVWYTINLCRHVPLRVRGKAVKTMVVLGSGGHTGEMLKMVSALDRERYCPRVYVVADTDSVSIKKLALQEDRLKEKSGKCEYVVEVVPRSREVGQSWSSSACSATWALLCCLQLLLRHRPNLLLTNGPGTCLPVCLAALLYRILAISHSHLVFVESLCRVKSLSLTGRLLYYITDDFFVQWPYLHDKYPGSLYVGRLV